MLTVKGVKGDVAEREEEGGRKGRGRKVVRKWWMRGEKKLLESRTNLVALLAYKNVLVFINWNWGLTSVLVQPCWSFGVCPPGQQSAVSVLPPAHLPSGLPVCTAPPPTCAWDMCV